MAMFCVNPMNIQDDFKVKQPYRWQSKINTWLISIDNLPLILNVEKLATKIVKDSFNPYENNGHLVLKLPFLD